MPKVFSVSFSAFLRASVSLLLLIGFSSAVSAKEMNVLVIFSESSATHTKVEQSITRYLGLPNASDNLRYHKASIDTAHDKIESLKPDLIVTIGSRAMKQHWHTATPRLYAFVTFSTFSALYNNEAAPNDRFGVIFLDQPLDRQLILARKIMPEAKIGLLLSNQSTSAASAYLSSQVLPGDNNIVVSYVDEKEQLVDQAKLLLNSVDILLATPDAAVWQPSSAKWLLYLAYQQRKPVVGFSEALTRAGTIASVYSEPEQIGRQVAEAIRAFVEGRIDWQKNTAPQYYRYSINETIANSLGISDDVLYSIEQQAN